MSSEQKLIENNNITEQSKKKLGPCCVCKQTKKLRDQCIFQRPEEECKEVIFKHNQCLKSHGFSPII